MLLSYLITKEDAGKPVSQILKTKMEVSRKLVIRLKTTNGIQLDGESVFVNKIVNEGSLITLNITLEEEVENIIPQEMPLNIIYEDDYLIAINKPDNTVIHPTSLHLDGTMANWLMAYYLKNDIKTKIRPVSRLDRNTTGIVIFAKNDYVQDYLIKQMKKGFFKKVYRAVTYGNWDQASGTIDLPIARKPGSIMLRHISSDGDRAITHYQVIQKFDGFTLMEFSLETGRTHQIRVHCQALNHPLVGDDLYPFLLSESKSSLNDETNKNNLEISQSKQSHNKNCLYINRQALHSWKTSFIHPKTKEWLTLEAPLPDDFVKLLELLPLNA